jgi:hypothetical protein
MMNAVADDEAVRKEKELQTAFAFYESAARNKDAEPQIFEGARIRYFALKNGDAWLQQEKKRVQSEKLEPEVDKYRQQYEMLKSESGVQKGYADSIAGVRDKQAALKGRMTGDIDFLGNLLDEKEAKLSAYNRYIELTAPAAVQTSQQIRSEAIPVVSYFAGFPASFLTVLDVVLAVFIILFLALVYYKGRDTMQNIFRSVYPSSFG